MPYNKYSRLKKIEERKSIRSAVLYGFLTILVIVLVVTLGLPAIVKFASFLADIRGSYEPISQTDTTPPAPPIIRPLPQFTKDSEIKVEGNTESASTVKITVGNREDETLADATGFFTLTVTLTEGQNTIMATSTDKNGNTSSPSNTQKVTYDKTPPEITVLEPTQTSFFGESQKKVNIKGTTEAGASVTINGRFTLVDTQGGFHQEFTLSDGENKITVEAIDQAGNSTKQELTLNFSQ